MKVSFFNHSVHSFALNEFWLWQKDSQLLLSKKILRGIVRAEKHKRQGKAIGNVWSQFFASMNKLVIQIIPRKLISLLHREIIDYLMESRFRDREPYIKIRTFYICPFKAMHQKLDEYWMEMSNRFRKFKQRE